MDAHRLLAAAGLVSVAIVAACGFSTSGLQEPGKGGSSTTSTSSSGGIGGGSSSSTSGGRATTTSSSSSGGSTCTNGKKDGDEVGQDCGGSCPACPNGTACTADVDCASGSCVEGVCCNEACTDGCKSCKGDMNGGTEGTCANVVAGKDPKAACSPGKCDGDGVCRCQNGKKDGAESDVDCGGECAGCGLVQACGGDGDCQSGHCVAEWDGSKICCSTSCSGTCKSCNIGPNWAGTCLPRQAGDPTPCTFGGACNLGGSCANGTANGGTCNGGGNCVSGICYQSICRPYSDLGGPCTNDYECPGTPGNCNGTTHLCQ